MSQENVEIVHARIAADSRADRDAPDDAHHVVWFDRSPDAGPTTEEKA